MNLEIESSRRDSVDAEIQGRRKELILQELNSRPFRPPWWLLNRHLQTMWSMYFRRLPRIAPRKERWTTPDGDFLNVHGIESRADRPTVLLLTGLEGCSISNYIVGLMEAFTRRDWSPFVMEWRSCGGEMNLARRLYHIGETSDLEFTVGRLIERRPGAPLFIVGFSLGGNVLAKWLGERGATAPPEVKAAAAVSAPFDLTASGPQLDRALGGLYARRFLRYLIPKAIAKERQYPGSLDVEAVRRCRTIEAFDTHATARLHGFRDAWEYWRACGCGPFLERIRRPILLLSSADDPFNPASALPREAAARSPWLHPQFTRRGGHVGFIHGRSPRRLHHWAEQQVVRFFEAHEKL